MIVKISELTSRHLAQVEAKMIEDEQKEREMKGKPALTNFRFKAELWVLPDYIVYRLIDEN